MDKALLLLILTDYFGSLVMNLLIFLIVVHTVLNFHGDNIALGVALFLRKFKAYKVFGIAEGDP